jgi:hypothetical protein
LGAVRSVRVKARIVAATSHLTPKDSVPQQNQWVI